MYRKSKSIEWRNKEIYAEHIAHLRNGQSVMLSYAALANRYDLGEEMIRKIVAEQTKNRHK